MPQNPTSYNTIFLSEEDLKAASPINENVDMKTLTPVIRMVQDIFLTKIIGTALLVDLQDKVYNSANALSGSTLTDDDKFLLNAYITPVLVWLVMQKAPVFMTFKFLNKGVSTQSSDNSAVASDQEIQLLVNQAKTAADWYTQRLIDYLNANTSLYPAYNQEKTIDDVIPATKGYKTSIFLGNTRESSSPWCIDCDWAKYFR